MTDDWRRTIEIGFSELRNLHQITVSAFHVVTENIFNLSALFVNRLHVHVANLTILIGEAGIAPPCQSRDGAHRFGVIHIESPHQRAIHLEIKSGGTWNELGVKRGEFAGGLPGTDQRFGLVIQLVKGVIATEVVELEVETTLCREARDGRWLANHCQACIKLGELRIEPIRNREGAIGLTSAIS